MKTIALALTLSLSFAVQAEAAQGSSSVQLGYATTAVPFVITASPFVATFVTFKLGKTWNKEIVAAKEDLTYFVVTEGQERTVRAEFAIGLLRQEADLSQFTDLEVAQLGILLSEQ